MARLESLGCRAALVGPEGSGKTTLLEDLAPRLESRGMRIKPLRLDDRRRRFSESFLPGFLADLESHDAILFDGAEMMGPLAWRLFRRRARKAAALIITLHRPGRLPTLVDCATSPELLQEIIYDLVSPDERPDDDEIHRLFTEHNGNLRLALRALYDAQLNNSKAESDRRELPDKSK